MTTGYMQSLNETSTPMADQGSCRSIHGVTGEPQGPHGTWLFGSARPGGIMGVHKTEGRCQVGRTSRGRGLCQRQVSQCSCMLELMMSWMWWPGD